MRIWSVHPRYLDPQGLVALWREALLAQAVLLGATKGYTQHPQLQRFKVHASPTQAIASYLHTVQQEATARGYRFDSSKIAHPWQPIHLTVTDQQLHYEWEHLLAKLAARSPALFERWKVVSAPEPHPLFMVIEGPVADWEKR